MLSGFFLGPRSKSRATRELRSLYICPKRFRTPFMDRLAVGLLTIHGRRPTSSGRRSSLQPALRRSVGPGCVTAFVRRYDRRAAAMPTGDHHRGRSNEISAHDGPRQPTSRSRWTSTATSSGSRRSVAIENPRGRFTLIFLAAPGDEEAQVELDVQLGPGDARRWAQLRSPRVRRGRHLRDLPATDGWRRRDQSAAARRADGVRSFAGPDFDRAPAARRRIGAPFAVEGHAERRRMVTPRWTRVARRAIATLVLCLRRSWRRRRGR